MKIIVYRKFHESDLYELTLAHTIFSTEHCFEQNEDLRKFGDAFDWGYPFEIIEGTELEWEVLGEFLWENSDINDSENLKEIQEGRIYVLKDYEIIDFDYAAKDCYKEIKELQDKIESLQWDLEFYDELYYDKKGYHIAEKFEN